MTAAPQQEDNMDNNNYKKKDKKKSDDDNEDNNLACSVLASRDFVFLCCVSIPWTVPLRFPKPMRLGRLDFEQGVFISSLISTQCPGRGPNQATQLSVLPVASPNRNPSRLCEWLNLGKDNVEHEPQ